VGAGIKNFLATGAATRPDIYVTSKIWQTDHAAADVEASCRQTLADLQLDYLDLYLIHWPVAWTHQAEYVHMCFYSFCFSSMRYAN
jgi:diketogulonate reductase-like aldo/keto reductase